ncbi:12443_t:CDS:2 [Cetraspora pellucida]|uniref:12443_t:CDS:1 n=1 Tax=Cetraspora pellucida TaxID=1433469 RepID=A0A9N8ZT19_9GLOM|nr:12443_t:CDS:2 [Cetraspora pellucida]
MAKEIQKIYDDPNCSLSWPKVLIADKGTKYMAECRDLFLRHDMRIQYAKSKQSVAITEKWVVSLHINDEKYNDFPMKLIHISLNKAVKKSLKGEKIFADPVVKHKRPIGYDELFLSSDVKV